MLKTDSNSFHSKQLNLTDRMHNIVTEKAEPIHSYSKFIQKITKQLQDKRNFSFGTHQRRLTQQLFLQKSIKSPGPGLYHPKSQQEQSKRYVEINLSIPFGTKIERFKKIKTTPGPGHYALMEQKSEIKRYSRSEKNKNNKNRGKKKERVSKQKPPGPGCYEVQSETNYKLKKKPMKEKLDKIKQKRKENINKLTKEFQIYYHTHNKPSLPQNQTSEELQKTVFKEKKQFPVQRRNRLRHNLHQRVKKYLPSLDLNFNTAKNIQIETQRSTNVFLKKNDNAYGSYLLNLQTSDPGIYHKTNEIEKYLKKSCVFLSKSKRQVF